MPEKTAAAEREEVWPGKRCVSLSGSVEADEVVEAFSVG